MSKIKLTGHASGSGVLTVTAPNTSTDRTITLPDATGTLLNSDASGNVGIGIASPLDILHLNDSDDDCVINLDTAQANKNSIVKFSDPDAQGRGMIQYNHTTDSLRTTVAGTERTRIHSDGVLTVPAGIALGVAATSNASSNTLDDYEEGTWTGTFTTASGSVTMNTAKDTGRYTKIGRTVHIQGLFVSQSHSSPSGELRLNGLPFACGSDTDLSDELWFYIGVNNIVNNNGATNQPLAAYIGPGMTHMIIYSCDGNNLGSAGNRINNNGFMGFSVTYTI